MATATKKVHPARPAVRAERVVAESASLALHVYQDNGGDYRWEIAGEGGESLAQCGSFASYADAERAALRVRDGAGSAQLEPVSPNGAGPRAV